MQNHYNVSESSIKANRAEKTGRKVTDLSSIENRVAELQGSFLESIPQPQHVDQTR